MNHTGPTHAVPTQGSLARFARQIALPGFGPDGQHRLANASALVVGLGALGSPAALYLAAAGIGRLTLVDPDRVDRTNLHRQILHGEDTVGHPKTDSAARALLRLNPGLHLHLVPDWFTAANAPDLCRDHDVVIDGSDNFPTRFLAHDAAYFAGKPVVHASVLRFEGQVSVFWRDHGACYRCLVPAPPPPGAVPSCAEAGVLGALTGLLGSLQALEAIKLLTGLGQPLTNRILHVDALGPRFREITLRPDPACPLCGTQPTITHLEAQPLPDPCPATPPIHAMPDPLPDSEIDAPSLRALLSTGWPGLLIDVRQPDEHAAGSIPGARLIPLDQLPTALPALRAEAESGRPIILHCQAGVRSARALDFLRSTGLTNTRHLVGGYLAWLESQA